MLFLHVKKKMLIGRDKCLRERCNYSLLGFITFSLFNSKQNGDKLFNAMIANIPFLKHD